MWRLRQMFFPLFPNSTTVNDHHRRHRSLICRSFSSVPFKIVLVLCAKRLLCQKRSASTSLAYSTFHVHIYYIVWPLFMDQRLLSCHLRNKMTQKKHKAHSSISRRDVSILNWHNMWLNCLPPWLFIFLNK